MDELDRYLEDASYEAGEGFLRLAAEYLRTCAEGAGAVSAGDPAEIARRFDEPLPLEGRPLGQVLARLRDEVVRDANRLSHPMYMGHQVSAPVPSAVWTELLVAALNQSLAVREMSPTLTPIERRVVAWCAEAVGWGPEAGGTLTSGGQEATFTALLAARAAALPDAWERGVGAAMGRTGRGPVVVCGEHAHYAVTRAAGAMGLGAANVVRVGTTPSWTMDVAALRRTLSALEAEGRVVVAVVATAGHTATGSVDDLRAVADACAERRVWLHVDGAHGASALFSARHRHRLAGIERADSVAWDPHKLLLLPLSAGMVLVRDEGALDRAFAQSAPYLFHRSGESRVPDQGVRSFMCSRRGDALKVWVALQRHGARGLGALHDGLVARTQELHDRLAAHPDFEPMHEPVSNILCFKWRHGDNRALRAAYNGSGAGWITVTELGGEAVLRVTVMNPRTGPEHVEALVEGLAACGVVAAPSR